jgi:DeoR/GlpR family transcriptional regulator of sugar metabolism
VSFFEGLFADCAFLGSGGVDAAAGLTDYHLDEIAVRKVQIAHSAQRFVLADSAKLGHVAVGRVCALDEITAVITDDDADERTVASLRTAGVEVLVAPTTRVEAVTASRTGT